MWCEERTHAEMNQALGFTYCQTEGALRRLGLGRKARRTLKWPPPPGVTHAENVWAYTVNYQAQQWAKHQTELDARAALRERGFKGLSTHARLRPQDSLVADLWKQGRSETQIKNLTGLSWGQVMYVKRKLGLNKASRTS